MVWKLYVLKSAKTGRFYIGHTNCLERRLAEHNGGQTRSTRSGVPWRLVHQESFTEKPAAAARERQIKAWKSHRSIEELIASSG